MLASMFQADPKCKQLSLVACALLHAAPAANVSFELPVRLRCV